MQSEPASASGGVADGAGRLSRLRWRSRRGLLENDLILERFFEQYGERLGEADIDGLDALLELSDNALLDLLLERTEPEESVTGEDARRVLGWLRTV